MKEKSYIPIWLILTLAYGCAPEFDARASELGEARILALQAEPAEVRPGEEQSYRFLLANLGNEIGEENANWAFCTTPKPVTEENIVSSQCLEDGVEEIPETGNPINTRMPSTSCIRFGPELVESDARPRDPDSTGGYFQPLRLSLTDTPTIGLARVRCNLAGAPSSIVRDYEVRYANNKNPQEPTLLPEEEGVSFDSLSPSSEVRLLVRWATSDRETFPVFDVEARELRDQQETLSTSWFATGGSFQSDTRTAADDERETINVWKAPQEAGTYEIYIVLRDSRGGVSWTSQRLSVQPP